MRIAGFVWLEQYVEKLAHKHDVTPEEVEAMFFARPRYRLVEKGHVQGENMYSAMGQTEEGRYLIAFFIHKEDGRALIISARTMDEAEKKRYGRT
ncbi:MAG: BrnT family toxin [Acidobacteriota bacterium]|nr:BrnT family toxin [Acidobacteriota bacterium]